MTDRVTALVKRVVKLERSVKDTVQPGLGNSSIEDGGIDEYLSSSAVTGTDEAQLVARYGTQFDGTHGAVALIGPIPPTPAGITVNNDAVAGGFRVHWNGTWVQTALDAEALRPTVAPLDFTRCEVHASTDPGFTALLADTLKTTISSPRGGEVIVVVPAGVDYYVRLVARTSAGKASAASAVAGPIQAGDGTSEGGGGGGTPAAEIGFLENLGVIQEFSMATALSPAIGSATYNSQMTHWPNGDSKSIPALGDLYFCGGWRFVSQHSAGPSAVVTKLDPDRGGCSAVITYTAITQYGYFRQLVPNLYGFNNSIWTATIDIEADGEIAVDCYIQARFNEADDSTGRVLVLDSAAYTFSGTRARLAVAFQVPDLDAVGLPVMNWRNGLEFSYRAISTSATTRTVKIRSIVITPGRVARGPVWVNPKDGRTATEVFEEILYVQNGGLDAATKQLRVPFRWRERKVNNVVAANIEYMDAVGNIGKVSTYSGTAGTRTDNVSLTALGADSTEFGFRDGGVFLINNTAAQGIAARVKATFY